ncbi:GNAT family N-acetyltransferase [Wukongibacter baidiensis]|uniref:GNAT family N-acetyltransferase n=1 Tax=Wukongibacter baidiensis TaxID=1723361 RepID=UPI003D7FE617
MLKIEKEQFDLISHLLNDENSHFPLLESILSDKKKGSVYVNSFETPTAALVISNDGWFYQLGGEDDINFNSGLEDIIVEETKNNKPILWFGISKKWRRKLGDNGSLEVKDFPRIQYRFNKSDYISYGENPFPYQLEYISKENVEKVLEYNDGIISFWGTIDNFIENGFGFILLDKEKIVAQCISASVENGEAEIDIETDDSYRGKGIARFMASCLIDECMKRCYIPKWDCAVGNIPSRKLADKLGFEKVAEYPFSYITSL